MVIDDLVNQSGEWLKGTGPESDVVVSSRVRLARNLNRYPFVVSANKSVLREIEQFVRGKFGELAGTPDLHYFPMQDLDTLQRHLLIERHLVSREHAVEEGNRAVALTEDETTSIMINEEDHLRLQVIRSGLQLEQAWEEINTLDTRLEKVFHYAFHSRFGYLTCCPTNVGTGLRLSVLVHLPAAVMSKQMEKVLQSLQRLNYSVRGLFGEGTSPVGDFFQVSNQITLGKVESEIVRDLNRVIPEVLKFERSWRQKLLEQERGKLEDKVWRAYGILTTARQISSEETMEMLSALRMGSHLKIIRGIPPKVLNELFILTQPAHLQRIAGRKLEPFERDGVRAEFIRKHVPSV